VSLQIFANIISKIVIRETNATMEIDEDIIARYSLFLNLKSCMFNKLERKRGGYCEKIKVKDLSHIN
jgi:hypothetical protein